MNRRLKNQSNLTEINKRCEDCTTKPRTLLPSMVMTYNLDYLQLNLANLAKKVFFYVSSVYACSVRLNLSSR